MTAARRARNRKLIKHPDLFKHVIERLRNGWTPEQISNRMILDQSSPWVCQETIYRYVYSKEGKRDDLWWYIYTNAPYCATPKAHETAQRTQIPLVCQHSVSS